MDQLIKKTVERLVHIAYDFYRVDKSEFTLLSESGYFELYNQINENEIKEVLKEYPHLIEDWLRISEDIRSSERWYFARGNDGKFYVGHYPELEKFKEINTTDEFYACATFIKRDAEFTRILFKK